ncbi:MAG: aminotransferase class I/II-fold pyridoxal phosphate-dependent enzyme [Alphaproteobacteria bacterium]|nr:aminotransferase class I/II-fold pyridoxal phosphate-dependent enzyme [Alphaproteobacteria bacterium]
MYWELAASSWGEEEPAALKRVIDTGFYTMGKEVAAFEAAFADYIGVSHAVMVNSGSSANLIATAAMAYAKDRPIQRGDEVIVPAISWATMYHPLQQYGLKLKVVDVDLETLNVDMRQMEAALTDRTRMVAAVSILGNPAPLDEIRAFCDRHDLWLLEDNCESLGADLGGKMCGSFGHIGTQSFFFSHHIATMEGGILLMDSTELCHLSKALRAHGWTRDLPADSPIVERTGDDFFEAYRFILPGYNVRPTELQGAVGLEQLKKLDGFVETRRANMHRFQALFGPDERFIIQKEHGRSSSFNLTLILNPAMPDLDRNKALAALKENDIGYRIITGGNILRHDVIKHYDYETIGDGCPNADIAHSRGFFLGNHPYDIRDKIERAYGILDKALS